jgi:hypothetical protein
MPGMTTMTISYDSGNEWDRAACLLAMVMKPTKCYVAIVGRERARDHEDYRWHDPRLNVDQIRGTIEYGYGEEWKSHPLKPAEVTWLNTFDEGKAHGDADICAKLPPLAITLNPSKDRTLRLRRKDSSQSKCGGVTVKVDDGTVATKIRIKNFGGPDGKGHTTQGCFTNEHGNSPRARRMRDLLQKERYPAAR